MAEWDSVEILCSKEYKCGYCKNDIISKEGYYYDVRDYEDSPERGCIYICPCGRPTYFDENGKQYPGAGIATKVNNIMDKDVQSLYKEADDCFSINAFTSSAACCRKLLMHVANKQGAKPGEKFEYYVDWLEKENFIPRNSKGWVDSIRRIGNKATHKIEFIGKADAEQALKCIGMLLQIIYEFPAIVEKKENSVNQNQKQNQNQKPKPKPQVPKVPIFNNEIK